MAARTIGQLSLGSLALGTLLSAQMVTLETIAIVPMAADLVRVSGSHAYVGAGRTLTVVDIRDPGMPKTRGSVDLSTRGEPRSLSTQELTGQTALVAVRGPGVSTNPPNVYVLGGGVLQVFDLTSPSTPKKVTTFKISERSQAVAVDGTLAYVAAGSDGLQ